MTDAIRPGSAPFVSSCILLASLALLILSPATQVAAEDNHTIESLLNTGWEIAGYSQAADNRSTFILFSNSQQTYLVQCRVGYDVTRSPSTYSFCYELR